MDNLEVTFTIIDDKLVCMDQDQVENIAISTLGTHENIYFEPIPLPPMCVTKSLEFQSLKLSYRRELGGWLLLV